MSKTVSIIYYSGYGHTAKVANTIAEGVKTKNVNVQIHAIDAEGNLSETAWNLLDASDAIIMGSPTYMGGPSWQFKKFAEASSKKWMPQTWKNKIAAGFTNSASYSGDKLATLQQIWILAMQQSMIWVGQAEMAPDFEGLEVPSIEAINRLGSFSGLMTQSNHKSGPDIMPPTGDLETAHSFGKRIAEITDSLKL
jgi:multimeric flavodoxin WrbA